MLMRFFEKRRMVAVAALAGALLGAGCSTANQTPQAKRNDFTSGSRDADQRAARTVPETTTRNERSRDKRDKEQSPEASAKGNTPENRTLYDRLGGEAGITEIVNDFLKRAMEDPRVNWSREGVKDSSWFRSKKVPTWQATPENVNRLKTHFVQFISLATGGPAKYDGRPMQAAHANMFIKKAEFDAAIGDLKATLDKLGIAPEVQKELMAIIESTRPEIAIDRRG